MQRFKINSKEYIMIIFGVILMALSMDLFLIPNKIAPGGFSGLATIIHYLFSINVGFVIAILNIPLFIIAFRKLGFLFCVKSLFAMVAYSFAIDLLPLPALTHDTLLAAIFGGIFMGSGMGIVLKAGATTGGTDTVAILIIRVFKSIKVNWLIFMMDFVVIVLAAFVFSPELSLYGLAAIFISSKVTEIILEGPNSSRMVFIMSRKSESISTRVMTELQRGATLLSGIGVYTKKDIDVLMCVVHRESEVQAIKEIVKEVDENAFLIVGHVKEVLGNGF